MKIVGEGIKDLIPQRDPIMMVDTLYSASETEATTGLTVRDTNLFLDNGFVSEAGIIEHIAQSASAFAGYKARVKNEPAPTGFIAEIRKFNIILLPCKGNEMRTHILQLSEALGVTLIQVETKVDDEIIAKGQMKIYIKPS
jgi:predicted hotdog family 3-hydroxylacyl-ACP dehydratase